jgi:uridine phosphorylase
MEAAAFFAVAEFRRVQLAQILYGGDDVGGEDWDHRDWQSWQTIREELVWLAAEACLAIEGDS